MTAFAGVQESRGYPDDMRILRLVILVRLPYLQ